MTPGDSVFLGEDEEYNEWAEKQIENSLRERCFVVGCFCEDK